MPDQSPRLGLPYMQPSQAQKHVTHNEALRLLDALAQLAVEQFDAQTPPAAPVEGECHALGAAPTGDWAGQAGRIALREEAAWRFLDPQPGWLAWGRDGSGLRAFGAAGWEPVPLGVDQVGRLGIAATPDDTNRLAVAADATLLSHDGSGHQLKVNKATAGDTASLLFQSGWTGHAEMGLAGDTAFSVRISADGLTWNEAMRADPGTQRISWAPGGAAVMRLDDAGLQVDVPVGGTAVQASAADTTAGRLMRADYGYGPGNLLGPVGQSGGIPTGAAIERGETADGEYVRFADGTQICTADLAVVYQTATKLQATWTYPAAFASATQLSLSGTMNISSLTAATAIVNEIFPPQFGTITTTSTLVRCSSIFGRAPFVAGDMVNCRVIAIGRWI